MELNIQNMKTILLLLVLIPLSQPQSLTLTASNTTINTQTTYQFTLTRKSTTPISPTDSITLRLPSDSYDSTQVSSVTCSPSCTLTNLSVVMSGGSFAATTQTIRFSVVGIVNPPSTKFLGAFTAQWTSSAGTLIESYTHFYSGFDAGVMRSCSVVFSPNTVSTVGSATFTITPGNPNLPNGSLRITFPTKWPNTNSAINDTVVNTSSPSLTCSSPSPSPSLFTSLTCTSYLNGDINISSFSTKSNSTFTFTVDGILSPPVSAADSTTRVSSYDGSGYLVDGASVCTVVAPQPSQLEVGLVGTMVRVAEGFTPVFGFLTENYIDVGDVLKLAVVNSNITVNSSANVTVTVIDVNNYSKTVDLNTSQSNTSANIYGFTLPKITWRNQINPNLQMYITGMTFTSPPNNQTLPAFTLTLSRNNFTFCSGTVSLTPSPSPLSNLTLTAWNPLINANTNYNLTFTTASPLSSKAWLQVILPYEITTTAYSAQRCVNAVGTNVSASAMCAMSNGTLMVTNLLSSALSRGNTVTVGFAGVRNPGSEKGTSAFQVTTFFDETSFMTDQNTSLVFAATADTIANCIVTRSNDTVGVSAVYTLIYTVKNQLPSNSSILIGLPPQITFTSTPTTTISSNNSNPISKPSTPINTTTAQFLNITQPYTSPIPAGTILAIQISSLVNPTSSKPPQSFSVASYYGGQYLVEDIRSGVTVPAATVSQFRAVAVSPNSKMNGEGTGYVVTFQSSLAYGSGASLRLTVPTDIKIPTSTLSCMPLSGFTSTSNFTCTTTGNFISITLPQAISSSTTYKLTIFNLTNPRTYTTSSSFTLTSFTDSTNTYSIDSGSASGITNSQPNSIVTLTSVVTNPSQSYLNSNQTIMFTVTTKNGLTSTDYIELTYPDRYTYVGSGNSSLCKQSTFTCIPNPNNLLKIKITCSTFTLNTSFSFEVVAYRSPNTSTPVTSYFTLNTFDSIGNPIDYTNTIKEATQTTFNPSCTFPCETCTTNTSVGGCLSCYNSSISSNVRVFLENGTCVDQCGTGFFAMGTAAVCTSCIEPCAGCVGTATNCTSCLNNVTLKFFNSVTGSCVSQCSSGYYPDTTLSNYVCSACTNNCSTCTSSSNCTTCLPTFLFHLNTCLKTCPSGFFSNINSNSCQPCDVSCATCTTTSTTCDLCATGYAKQQLSSTVCSTDCGSKVPYMGLCQCDGICLGCKGTIQNCTSCDAASQLYPYYYVNNGQGTCWSSCPYGMYVELGKCTTCVVQCKACTAKSNCTECSAGYVLFEAQCIGACPAGYYNRTNICTKCSDSCMTCSSAGPEICTSCKTGKSLSGSSCEETCPSTTVSQVNPLGGRICNNCTANCRTCSVISSNCTDCLANFNLYFSSCISTCPATTFQSANNCLPCSTPCQTCNLSSTDCLSCPATHFSIKSSQPFVNCVPSCQPFSLFANGSECITCQPPCATCSKTAFNCTSCNSSQLLQVNNCVDKCSNGYLQYERNCLLTCPENMTGYNGSCTNQTVRNMTVVLEQKSVPVPFTLAVFVGAIAVAVARFVAAETFMPSMAVAVIGVLETFAWVVVLILTAVATQTTLVHYGLICMAVAIGVHFLINILAFVFFFKLKTDDNFSKWYNRFATLGVRLPVYLLSSINHKFLNLIFSKCFGSPHFKAPLSVPSSFTPLLICTSLSFLPQLLSIAGCALSASDPNTPSTSQLYMQCIDSIIVTIFTLICSLWNLKKPNDFYEKSVEKYEVRDEINNNYTVEELNQHLGREELVAEPGRKPTYDSDLRGRGDPMAQRKLLKATHRVNEDMSKEVEGGEQPNVIAVIRRKYERGGEDVGGFSDTSSEFVSETHQMAVANQGKDQDKPTKNSLLMIKMPTPTKHHIPSDQSNQSQSDHLQKIAMEQKQDSIVNKLMTESASDADAKEMLESGLENKLDKQSSGVVAQENADETLPDKPTLNATLPIKLLDKTQADNSERVASEIVQVGVDGGSENRGGFSFDRRLDLEIEDMTDFSEQVPKVPSFQTGRPRPDTQVLNLNTYKSSQRYQKPHKVNRKPVNTSSILNQPANHDQVPSKPQILRSVNIEAQKARLQEFDDRFTNEKDNNESLQEENYNTNMDISPSAFNELNQRFDQENVVVHPRKRNSTLEEKPSPENQQQKSVLSIENVDIISNIDYQHMLAPQSKMPLPEYHEMSKTSANEQFYNKNKAQNEVVSNKVRSLQRIYLQKIDGKRKPTTSTERKNHDN